MANCTWAEIDAIAQAGVAAEVFSVGDTKDFIVNSETITAEIIAFNHDTLENSSTAKITFDIQNALTVSREFNSTGTDAYQGSDIYDWLTGEFYNAFPSDLKNIIKNTLKYTWQKTGSSSTLSRNAVYGHLFLFSEYEVTGEYAHSYRGYPPEGTVYSFFSSQERRVKSNNWWLRSREDDGHGFCIISSSGEASFSYVSAKQGVVFGFCI